MKKSFYSVIVFLILGLVSAQASEFCVSIKSPGSYGFEGWRSVYCKTDRSIFNEKGLKRVEARMQKKGYEIQSTYYDDSVLVFQKRSSRALFENIKTCLIAEDIEIPHPFTSKGPPVGYEINCGDDVVSLIQGKDAAKKLAKFAEKNGLKKVYRVDDLGWYHGRLTAPYTVRNILIYQSK